jgi:hypothetical protein
MPAISSSQSLVVCPTEDLADQLDLLLRQVNEWRNRALLAEAQLSNRRYAVIGTFAAGRVAALRTVDGDYIVLQAVAQFNRPEQALLHARRTEREMLAGLVNEE